jgi:hypothetical protein
MTLKRKKNIFLHLLTLLLRHVRTITKRCRLSWLTNSALVYEPKSGGIGGCRVSANMYSCAHGAQINFGNLTPYLTYGTISLYCIWLPCFRLHGTPITALPTSKCKEDPRNSLGLSLSSNDSPALFWDSLTLMITTLPPSICKEDPSGTGYEYVLVPRRLFIPALQ